MLLSKRDLSELEEEMQTQGKGRLRDKAGITYMVIAGLTSVSVLGIVVCKDSKGKHKQV